MAVKRNNTTKRSDDVPVFLKKTWNLINTCDPRIASWSEDGLTFVVLDVDAFARNKIPQFFRHRNMSSFIRQLNSYGFSKVRDDPNDEKMGWSRFKHEYFIRGRADLLKNIRKTNQINPADQTDVDKLTDEVGYLRTELCKMALVVQQMSGMLRQMPVHDSHHLRVREEPLTKKRKIEVDHVESMSAHTPALFEPNEAPYHDNLLEPTMSDSDLFLEDTFPLGFMPANQSLDKCTSADFVASMFDLDDYDETSPAYHDTVPLPVNSAADIQPDAVNSASFFNRRVSSSEDSSATHHGKEHHKKLNDAISKLPKSLQKAFVERIVENIANPDAYKKHVEAVSVLATAAAIDAQNMVTGEDKDKLSMGNQSDMALPVATAALGAFLANYGNATSEEKPASTAAA